MFIEFKIGGSSIYINVNMICAVEKGKFGTHISTCAGKEHQVTEDIEYVMSKIKAAK